MNISIDAYLPTNNNIVQSHLVNSTTDLHNAIYICNTEDAYHREVEHKLRQEFNEYMYYNYCKFGKYPCEYTKNKLWKSFKCEKRTSSFASKLAQLWEQFEEDYLW